MTARKQTPRNCKTGNGTTPGQALVSSETAFGYPRDFLENRYVYLVISPRAGGLSVGVNLNPVVKCTFECLYCEVDRSLPARAPKLVTEQMARELFNTLELVHSGRLRQHPRYGRLPEDLLKVRQVTLSGDGEPTLARDFVPAIQAVVHVRALGNFPFFKVVLITNSTQLSQPEVLRGLRLLTREDEIWAKLDAGTQQYFTRINGSTASLEDVTQNILEVARRRPVVIQSLFPAIDGRKPPKSEIQAYARRLKLMKESGADIPLVQIYSATRPMARARCSHLPLKTLSGIAQTVRRVAGLRAEVY